MRDEILELLVQWKNEVEKKIQHKGIYLFGSLVTRKGATFNNNSSDVDLVIVMPDTVEDNFIKRRNWVETLFPLKLSLEQKLFSLLKRKDSSDQIVSLLSVTRFEIEKDIHKSKSKPFFKVTNFIEIGSNKPVKGRDLASYVDIDNSFLEQVFNSVQKSRNDYFASCPIGNLDRLQYDKIGQLPKDLCREAGKINSYSIEEIKDPGDYYSTAFGFDLLKANMQKRIDDSSEFEELYHWMNGNQNGKELLEEEKILLLYELLYDLAIQIDLSSKQKSGFVNIQINIKKTFQGFLESTDMLEKSHPDKLNLKLNDIFINPQLEVYDDLRETHSSIDSLEFFNNFISYGKTLVAGEGQSGKTAFCKVLFQHLVEQNYIPIYLNDKGNGYSGNFKTKLRSAFDEQLTTSVEFDEIDFDRIVPIIDNFHFAKNKGKLIDELKEFPCHLIIVDDLFELNFSNEMLIKSYDHFNITELSAVLRNSLITKWVDLSVKKKNGITDDNDRFAEIDKFTELIETTLGKLLGEGIMPSYPFFILSVISTFEASSSTKKDITSQGHCYYALIYMYLINAGVKDEDFDEYLNFLTELAYFCYDNGFKELPSDKFTEFTEQYDIDYNRTVELEEQMSKLASTNIVKMNSCGNYEFCYSYIYYYFTGKYFADNFDSEEEEIKNILKNLHNNDFAYIAVFISHHTKNIKLLNELIETSEDLFNSYSETTLSAEELGFFDDQIKLISAAVLPSASNLPQAERRRRLEEKDKLTKAKEESIQQRGRKSTELDEKSKEFGLELRRSIKTVEVMGRIIKNRHGSIKNPELRKVFEKGMNIHLRILKSFIELISIPESQLEIVDFISKRIDSLIKEKGINPSSDDLAKLSKEIFWNSNFSIVYGFMQKIIHSLGSKKLLRVSGDVCDEKNSPAAEIVRHGILMWYAKNIQVDSIKESLNDPNFSKTAASVMKHQIANHSKMHKIGYKKLQKIESELKMSSKRLISVHMKAKNK